MPLRESLPDELIDNVADLLRLRAKMGASDDLKLWVDKMLKTACRHIEYFIEPEVSVKAATRWKENGGQGDLAKQRYRPPSKWPRGKGLQFEHAVPAGQILDELVVLGPKPSAARVREVLETAEIVWITTDEDEFDRAPRPNWRELFASKGITLVQKEGTEPRTTALPTGRR